MSKEKTVKEWLSELPDGYRERALSQWDGMPSTATSLTTAIFKFEDWSDTHEGPSFWREVARYYDIPQRCSELPPLPADHFEAVGCSGKTDNCTDGDDCKPTNPKDACGVNKVPLSGMPAPVLLECGLVKLHGDLKYGSYNWRDAGVRASVYYDAAIRHLMAWWEGEDLDPDSMIHHLSHDITGLAVLRDAIIQDNWIDDRPKPTKSGWITEYNKMAKAMIAKHNESIK